MAAESISVGHDARPLARSAAENVEVPADADLMRVLTESEADMRVGRASAWEAECLRDGRPSG